MQEAKIVKVRIGSAVVEQLEQVAVGEAVAMAEVVRRALQLYLDAKAAGGRGAAGRRGPAKGPSRALDGPAPPSSPPPSSPPAPPLTPPSLSPPAQGAATPRRTAAAPGENGCLFPELAGPAAPDPPAPPELPADPPRLLFPCVATKRQGGEAAPQWPLTAPLLAQWEETFPGMDVLGEARKAREWLLVNHRKTYGGMSNFLFRWLCRAQDSGRFMRRTAATSCRQGAAPRPPSLEEAYGFASWAEWEAMLRQYFQGQELEEDLQRLAEIRAEWEAQHG